MEGSKRQHIDSQFTSENPNNKGNTDDNLIIFPDIPRSVLAGLLDLAGHAGGISPRPLMGEPCEVNPHQLAELYAGDVIALSKDGEIKLSPIFTRVAEVLLNPRTNVTFRLWGSDNMCAETNIQFPGQIFEGDGVILNPIGSYYRISAFADDSQIVELLGQVLPPRLEEAPAFEFETHLDISVAVVLFGAIDLARRRARSGSGNETASDIFIFSAQQLNNYLFDDWGFTDFDDLVTYVAAAGAKYEPPSLSETIQALRSLADNEVLNEAGIEQFSLSPVLQPLVSLTYGPLSGLQWQRIALLESGELFWSDRIYVFGDKLLILCFSPTVEGKISITAVSPGELNDFLVDELASSPLFLIEEAKVSSTSQAIEPSVEPSLPSSTQAEELPVLCPNCHQPLKAGSMFCNKCGSAVIHNEPPPPPSLTKEPAAVGPPLTGAAAPETTVIKSPLEKQLETTRRDIETHRWELGKVEVRYKTGELSAKQYKDSDKKLCARIVQLEKSAEKLKRLIQTESLADAGTVVHTQAAVPPPPPPVTRPTTCPECGAKLRPTAKFCAKCGHQL